MSDHTQLVTRSGGQPSASANDMAQRILQALYLSQPAGVSVVESPPTGPLMTSGEVKRTFTAFEPRNYFGKGSPEGPPRWSSMHPGHIEMAIVFEETPPLEWQLRLLERRHTRTSPIYFVANRLLVIASHGSHMDAIEELVSEDILGVSLGFIIEELSTELRRRFDLAIGPENYKVDKIADDRFSIALPWSCADTAKAVVTHFGSWFDVTFPSSPPAQPTTSLTQPLKFEQKRTHTERPRVQEREQGLTLGSKHQYSNGFCIHCNKQESLAERFGWRCL